MKPPVNVTFSDTSTDEAKTPAAQQPNPQRAASLKQLKETLLLQIKQMESGEFGTHVKRDGEMIDTTPQAIERARKQIADIDAFLASQPTEGPTT